MKRWLGSGSSLTDGVGNKVAHTVSSGLRGISEGFTWIGIVSIVFIMLIIVGNVFGRYLFNSPISGIYEIIEAVMVFAAFSGMIIVTVRGRNVRVDILVSRFPGYLQRVLVSLMFFIAAGAFAILAWQLGISAVTWMHRDLETVILHIPLPYIKFAAAVGAGLVCLMFLISFIRSLGKER